MSDCSVVIGMKIGYSPSAVPVAGLHADPSGAEDRQPRHLDRGDREAHERRGARFERAAAGSAAMISGSVS